MPATTVKSTKARTTKASAPKTRAKRAPVNKAPAPQATAAKLKSAAAKTADLSQDVFTSVEAGQRSAIAAVRTFVDTVDNALPAGVHPSRRETVIDAALDMADKLVTTQFNFLRHVVRSADRSISQSQGK